MVREKIRASQLINALQNHVLGKRKMAASQVTAGLGLLKKIVPDMSTHEHSGPGGGPIEMATPLQTEAAAQILERIRARSGAPAGSA